MTSKPHFSLLATSFAGGPRPRTTAVILFGLWLTIFFASLFAPPVLDDADATHASAARTMATTGDLVTLKVDGISYLEKAPLPYWLVALSFRLFGFNTFATHLPEAIAVGLLMLLGHRWANQAFGSRTGFYTAAAVLTSLGVFLFTRILIPEVLLSLFLGVALFSFLKSLGPIASPSFELETRTTAGVVRERPAAIRAMGPRFYPAVMWVALAAAVLTKGLVALVFFFATALAFLALVGELREIRKLHPVSGLLLFLLIAAPWHILAGLRNTGGMDGHGFFWFYFVNEHVLRFLGRRIPRDYNKLPGWVYWLQHLAWLFPWSLFLPLGFAAIWRRFRHQAYTLTRNRNPLPPWPIWLGILVLAGAAGMLGVGFSTSYVLAGAACLVSLVVAHRVQAGFTASPFYRIDPQQRTILLLSLFSAIVLLFFSLSTNQEYYTFPIYLPVLLLIAATITRAEQTFASDADSRRWISVAHAALSTIGGVAALLLLYGLWCSRRLPFVANVGDLLAHRGVGDYTLSMSHLFDLTTASFAALRLPAALAAIVLLIGPAIAWMLRAQRRHLAATSAIAFTAAAFLVAAQMAFARFGTMLSSQDFAARIEQLEGSEAIDRSTRIALYGDQANGSSIPFYLGRQVDLVEGRSSSMLFGSTLPGAPHVFLTDAEYKAGWGHGERKVLFVPAESRAHVAALLGGKVWLLRESSGKALLTDRPLAVR
jgi:4-amino-4-deoxy-L-arabinose transferase-like glycosyltransferase